MDIRVESWYRAVFGRISRRSFTSALPEEKAMTRLEELAAEFRPYPGARVEIVRKSPEDVFKGIIGNYGKISGAPYYAAFIADCGMPRVEEGVGYTGEGLILEATALGLATCWVSGFFRPEAVRGHLDLGNGERVFSITPLGLAGPELSAKDRLYRRAAGSRRRKPLVEIMDGSPPLPWQEKALEAARLAPSAANRQPWRFVLEPQGIIVQTAGAKDSPKYPKRLDCGIAMLHIELGAKMAGAPGTWSPLPSPGVARYDIR